LPPLLERLYSCGCLCRSRSVVPLFGCSAFCHRYSADASLPARLLPLDVLPLPSPLYWNLHRTVVYRMLSFLPPRDCRFATGYRRAPLPPFTDTVRCHRPVPFTLPAVALLYAVMLVAVTCRGAGSVVVVRCRLRHALPSATPRHVTDAGSLRYDFVVTLYRVDYVAGSSAVHRVERYVLVQVVLRCGLVPPQLLLVCVYTVAGVRTTVVTFPMLRLRRYLPLPSGILPARLPCRCSAVRFCALRFAAATARLCYALPFGCVTAVLYRHGWIAYCLSPRSPVRSAGTACRVPVYAAACVPFAAFPLPELLISGFYVTVYRAGTCGCRVYTLRLLCRWFCRSAVPAPVPLYAYFLTRFLDTLVLR